MIQRESEIIRLRQERSDAEAEITRRVEVERELAQKKVDEARQLCKDTVSKYSRLHAASPDERIQQQEAEMTRLRDENAAHVARIEELSLEATRAMTTIKMQEEALARPRTQLDLASVPGAGMGGNADTASTLHVPGASQNLGMHAAGGGHSVTIMENPYTEQFKELERDLDDANASLRKKRAQNR